MPSHSTPLLAALLLFATVTHFATIVHANQDQLPSWLPDRLIRSSGRRRDDDQILGGSRVHSGGFFGFDDDNVDSDEMLFGPRVGGR
eukprot:CAMPEP_0117441384 /NCGR_PEP_ID=MMETSP0759-20121206/3608_1 /TAXON_ID=63605 /ORGANISM="Percolomonas cosmopolitus, Strain WS" /LENGTH=86 /DNA_ID=CAMNT_0005233239 /DNA_START=421 /DNA_END=677 /DNA_ORIENTATION=-